MKNYKLAIIGSGALGSIIGKVVSRDLSKEYDILGVFGYSGSFCASDFGRIVPVISVQTVPFFSIKA